MEDQLARTLLSLAEARNSFFRRIGFFRRSQEDLISRFLSSESRFIESVERLLRNRTPLYINFPINIPQNFMEPIPILPTEADMAREIVPYQQTESQVSCAICQEVVSNNGSFLRGCEHVYHSSCIRTWFGVNTRCPVCRRDIREGQESQTSSA